MSVRETKVIASELHIINPARRDRNSTIRRALSVAYRIK